MQLSFRYFEDYSIFLTDLYLLCKLNLLCFSFHIFAFFFLCKGNIIIFTVSAMSIVYKLHIHSVKLHILKFRWGHHSFPLKHLFSLFNQPCLGFSRKIFFFKKLLLHCSMGKKMGKKCSNSLFFLLTKCSSEMLQNLFWYLSGCKIASNLFLP